MTSDVEKKEDVQDLVTFVRSNANPRVLTPPAFHRSICEGFVFGCLNE